jgi:hypothetical protein
MIFLSELEEISKEVTRTYNVGSWYFFGSEIGLNRAKCHFEMSQVFIAYRHIISRFTVRTCVCVYMKHFISVSGHDFVSHLVVRRLSIPIKRLKQRFANFIYDSSKLLSNVTSVQRHRPALVKHCNMIRMHIRHAPRLTSQSNYDRDKISIPVDR